MMDSSQFNFIMTVDHSVLCKAALIIAMTRWVFFWAQKFLTNYMCECDYSFPIENQPSSCSSEASTDFCLEIARQKLKSTTFGEIEQDRGICQKSCAVCLKNFKKNIHVYEICNCGHVFHRDCLDRWLRYDARLTCPLCRTSLIDLRLEASSPVLQQQPPPQQPSWAVERIMYLFGDDLLGSSSSSSSSSYTCSSS